MTRIPTTILFFLLSTQTLLSNSYNARCAHCHGTNGDKGALGRTATIKDMSKEEILEKMYLYKNGKLNTYGMGGLMKSELLKVEEKYYPSIASHLSNLKKEEKE